jgi:hypothetical protein
MSDRTMLTSAVCPECHLHRGHRANCSAERERLHGPTQDLSLEAYRAFLKEKIVLSEDFGFEIEDREINAWLKPHAKTAVKWAARTVTMKAPGGHYPWWTIKRHWSKEHHGHNIREAIDAAAAQSSAPPKEEEK